MKKVAIPAYFSTLNKRNVTLYLKKDYENKMSDRDIEGLFNLCNEPPLNLIHSGKGELNNSYKGRTPCKTLSMESLANESFVVREYWHGGMIGKIFRDFFWNGMRPVRELSVCEAASRGGIKTTEIIAIVKDKILGPLYKFRLVTKEITESIDLIELLLHSGENRILRQKRQIINKLAKAINDMHDMGIYHADLHLKNILVQSDAGGGVHVYIIDLDKSKQYENVSFQRRMKNIMRLDRSLEKFKRNVRENLNVLSYSQSDLSLDGSASHLAEQITNIDKVRFLKEYIKISDSPEQRCFRNQKEFLKYCLTKYQTTHKSHRIWWRIVNGKF